MEKLQQWDRATAQDQLKRRLSAAKSKRTYFEDIWLITLDAAYRARSGSLPAMFMDIGTIPVGLGTGRYQASVPNPKMEQQYSEVFANYIQKDIRYLHSQLSNNPPSVVPQATSSDPKDRSSAQAANNVIKYCMRQYRLQEVKDLCSLWALTTGTGYTKTVWNPRLGEPLEFDPETFEVVLEGDLDIYVPKTWDIYCDPDAKVFRDVRFFFERFDIPAERALLWFGQFLPAGTCDKDNPDKIVELYQYWEKGLPENGYQGRFCWCMPDGTLLQEQVGVNPHGPVKKLANGQDFRMAQLPLQIFTDIDIPGTYIGIPTVLFTVELQRELNFIDRLTFSAIRANGTSRMVMSNDTKLSDDSVTNDPYDILIYEGEVPPVIQAQNPVSPIIPQIREALAKQIPELNGINESMYGNISRETAGAALQYATQQGQALRARTFTKFVQYVEDLYKNLLTIVREHWDTPRMLSVEGKENAFSVVQFQGSDIEKGYEFMSKYGTDFSLDPQQRRQEIIQLWPIFKEIGVDPRLVASMLQLNDIESMFGTLTKAFSRQKELFDKMISSPTAEYIPPEELQEHKGMLKYAYDYIMSAEFFNLNNEKVKQNILRHIKEREQFEQQRTQAMAPMAPTGATPPPAQGGAAVGEQPQMPQNLGALLGGM